MTRRQEILDQIRLAGYRGDEREARRIWVDSQPVPVSYRAYRKAYELGRRQAQAEAPKA